MTTEMTSITSISIIDGMASIEAGAGNGDACDLPATFAAFAAEVTEDLQARYPGVEVTYRWENSNRGLGIDALEGDYDPDQYDEIAADIQHVAEEVYERGIFWVAA